MSSHTKKIVLVQSHNSLCDFTGNAIIPACAYPYVRRRQKSIQTSFLANILTLYPVHHCFVAQPSGRKICRPFEEGFEFENRIVGCVVLFGAHTSNVLARLVYCFDTPTLSQRAKCACSSRCVHLPLQFAQTIVLNGSHGSNIYCPQILHTYKCTNKRKSTLTGAQSPSGASKMHLMGKNLKKQCPVNKFTDL